MEHNRITAAALSAVLAVTAIGFPAEVKSPVSCSIEAWAEVVASGECGKNLTWTLKDFSKEYGVKHIVLTISGSGDMDNYPNEVSVPWHSRYDDIVDIEIYTGTTSIGDYAFYHFSKIKSINIPSSVTSIGKAAFYKCTSLKKVNMHDSITSIGDFAFSYCTSLSSIDIPDSVTSIGKCAFSDCTSLDTIDIPASVENIELSAFPDNLYFIRVDENNKYYSSYYGSLYNKDKSELIMCPRGKNTYSSENVRFPDSVKTIGKSAFENCTKIESITLPDSVTTIEERAFYKCTGLKSITLPDSVTSIGYEAFRKCTSLESVTIPDSVTSIGSLAFYGCKSLKSMTFPDSVASIGVDALGNCKNLESITILNPECVFDYSYGVTGTKIGIVDNETTIKGYKGSTAEDYAHEYNYPFVALDDDPQPETTPGDANCDGEVNMADAVLIMQTIGNPDKYRLSADGEKNADVDATPGVTNNDALKIQRYKLGIIESLS